MLFLFKGLFFGLHVNFRGSKDILGVGMDQHQITSVGSGHVVTYPALVVE